MSLCIAEQPDATLAELGARLDRPFRTSTVDLWLRRLGWKFKKTRPPPLRSAAFRNGGYESCRCDSCMRYGSDKDHNSVIRLLGQ